MSEIHMTRADTWFVTVTLNGQALGEGINAAWDVKEGGDVDSAELTYKPGGMADPISLGGSRNVNNVTLRRGYRLARDHAHSQRLINQAGRGKIVITQQPLDRDGVAYGVPITYKGILKRVKFPDHDSNSNDAALVEIEVTISGMPTGMSVG